MFTSRTQFRGKSQRIEEEAYIKAIYYCDDSFFPVSVCQYGSYSALPRTNNAGISYTNPCGSSVGEFSKKFLYKPCSEKRI